METGNSPETAPNQPISTENKASSREKKAAGAHVVREWALTLAAALVVAWIIRSTVIEPFVVVGASMDPTFSTGQFLLVDRLTYDFKAPQRDDVIVFKYPNDPSQDYIKRVIGLPGETVIIQDGGVSIESTPSSTPIALNEPYIEASHASHDDLTVTLDSDHYFVMGDNRAESSDSRAWGPLPENLIIGRPLVRLMPLNGLAILPGVYHQ
jgi:signal peptidase I